MKNESTLKFFHLSVYPSMSIRRCPSERERGQIPLSFFLSLSPCYPPPPHRLSHLPDDPHPFLSLSIPPTMHSLSDLYIHARVPITMINVHYIFVIYFTQLVLPVNGLLLNGLLPVNHAPTQVLRFFVQNTKYGSQTCLNSVLLTEETNGARISGLIYDLCGIISLNW